KPMDVGVFLCSTAIEDPFESATKLHELGVNNTQIGPLGPDFYTDANADRLKAHLAELGITPTTLFVGFPGESYASMAAVKETVGLVVPDKLDERVAIMKRAIEFTARLGAPRVALHVGFVPPDASDPLYAPLVQVIQAIADYCSEHGLGLSLETGQETAEELLEFIHAVDRPNMGINFDPANLILYGKDRPIEALESVKDHVVSCHCKDGVWPTQEGELGSEMPLGEGQVDIPAFVAKLKAIGYQGPLTIEREAGDDRIGDILRAKALLEQLRG
ncbi:MAG: sugar phosphate isomerase/epimerase, partial [Armatimonadetes bacterium]|nr:sugar phosphate isomerase/epimerase [Armatimonadota bacterium]